jgi:DNA-binding GntR family transcriptional regulator
VIYHEYTPSLIPSPSQTPRQYRGGARIGWHRFAQEDKESLRVRLSEKAYRLIKQKVVTLELPPSAVIDEQVLMQELDLGRTPIREALQRLDSEGLVNIVPRRGTFVSDISITDLQAIFELRTVLEGFCARLAAQRITPNQIEKMEAVLRDLERVHGGDHPTLMGLDQRFHRLLYTAADNEFLTATLDRLYDLSLRLWHLVLNDLEGVRHSIEQNGRVIDALREGDGAEAEAFMQEHIVEFQRKIKAVL